MCVMLVGNPKKTNGYQIALITTDLHATLATRSPRRHRGRPWGPRQPSQAIAFPRSIVRSEARDDRFRREAIVRSCRPARLLRFIASARRHVGTSARSLGRHRHGQVLSMQASALPPRARRRAARCTWLTASPFRVGVLHRWPAARVVVSPLRQPVLSGDEAGFPGRVLDYRRRSAQGA
jgi:hypothetical protein